jgi:preprotein translocase subunit SecD
MRKNIKARVIFIVIVVGLCALAFYPPREKIKLGLDLKGGSHLVLEVNTEEAVEAEILQLKDDLVAELNERTILFDDVKLRTDLSIEINVRPDQRLAIKELVDEDFPVFDFKVEPGTPNRFLLVPKQAYTRDIKEKTMRQTKNTLSNRVDEFGVEEPVIERKGMGGNQIVLELPGLDDPERIKERLKTVAKLEWKEVIAGPFPSREAALSAYGGKVPEDMDLLSYTWTRGGRRGRVEYYLLRKKPIISGQELKNARRGTDENGFPAVDFSLSPKGGRDFARFTERHIGDLAAIVLDNKIQSIPVVKTRVGSRGQITGSFTQEEAQDLALLLRAGALPASMTYIEERTVGPSLGWDSIKKGIIAAIIGLLAVVIFMPAYYKWSGINANVALVLNMLLILGVLAYFKATLTLPGIAGLILIIGMSVDANVLIFERIREELRLGKTVRSAVAGGFSKAFWTIFDANITTLIAALFLFQFGTGPIKGFAVTLSIGILASMFTAIFVSRTIFEIILKLKARRIESLSI